MKLLAHSLTESFSNLWRLAVHGVLRLAPVELASAAGATLAQVVVRTSRRNVLSAAHANFRFHRPLATDEEASRAVDAFIDNIGRLMAEFSVMDRIAAQGRITLLASGRAHALMGREPVICLMVHTGNWEMFGPALQQAGYRVSSLIDPPMSAAERRIAESIRLKMGFDLLTPDQSGLRRAIRTLGQNGTVSIFVDEARSGRTMAPFFGRPPHVRGNLAVAARLARRTNAQLLIGYCERHDGCRFRLHVSDPFQLPGPAADLLEDVRFLNGLIEPIILDHLHQWYFLDDSLSLGDETAEQRPA
ncbi:MAG: lysophospholipid acyltransferase family protein [Beijerinckiaceae bacterium]